MLLKYRDPQFWEKFQRQHWQPRVPTVIRRPFARFPFTDEMVLRGLNAFHSRVRSGDKRFRHILAVDGKRPGPPSVLRDMFREPSRSMDEFESACLRTLRRRELGLMVNDFQSLDPELWRGFSAFLQDAHRWIDFPIARAIVDLFFGNPSQSFFGVHKDTQEIFGFVVRGTKRMLFWPFDYFTSRVKGITAAAWYFQLGIPVDYRKYAKDALVLEAGPGDIIYWPRDYWHVAENPEGQFSAMLSLGLFVTHHVSEERAPALEAFRKKVSSKEGLRSGDVTACTQGLLGARRLRWATGTSFNFGSPVASKTPPAAKVTKRSTSLLLWSRRGSRVLVSANGHTATLPYSRPLGSLLENLARGKRVPVPPARTGATIRLTTTTWDAEGKPGSRRLVSRQDPRTWLLRWLTGIGATNE